MEERRGAGRPLGALAALAAVALVTLALAGVIGSDTGPTSRLAAISSIDGTPVARSAVLAGERLGAARLPWDHPLPEPGTTAGVVLALAALPFVCRRPAAATTHAYAAGHHRRRGPPAASWS